MSARNLIALANSKSIGIGRNAKNRYRWTVLESGTAVDREFVGAWSEFVAFIKSR